MLGSARAWVASLDQIGERGREKEKSSGAVLCCAFVGVCGYTSVHVSTVRLTVARDH